MRPNVKVVRVMCFGAVLGALSGCMSIQNHAALDALPAAKSSQSPFVEAFFEYPGPREKWAGPGNWTVHLNARTGLEAQVSVSPQPEAVREHSKLPVLPLTAEVARSQLASLSASILAEDQAFQGCLSPVRVRLVRQDGNVVEKQGCRSQAGWPGLVSRSVSGLIQNALAMQMKMELGKAPPESHEAETRKPAEEKK